EVMAEQHPFVRRIVVRPVILGMRRRDSGIVQRHRFRRDERAVVPIRDHEDPDNRDDNIESLHGPHSSKDGLGSRDEDPYTRCMSPFARLLGYVLRYRREFLIGLGCVVVTRAIALSGPTILGYAVDDLRRGVTRAKLLEYGAILFGIGILSGIFLFL